MTRSRDAGTPGSASAGTATTWAAGTGRALRESLEAFASEGVSREILVNALADAGFDAPPEHPDELEDFAHGALRSEITAVLGAEVADAVAENVIPIVALMRRDASSSDVVRRAAARPSRAPRSTPPHASIPAEPLRALPSQPPARVPVVVCTADPLVIECIRARTAGPTVLCVTDLRDMPPAHVVVFDTRASMTPLRAVWSPPRAPSTLIVWPALPRDRHLVQVLQPHVAEVLCASDEADALDVLTLATLHATR